MKKMDETHKAIKMIICIENGMIYYIKSDSQIPMKIICCNNDKSFIKFKNVEFEDDGDMDETFALASDLKKKIRKPV